LKEVRIAGKTIRPNLIDKAIEYFDPNRAARRMRSRAMMAITGQYIGGSTSRRQTARFNPRAGDADSDIVYDLSVLRARSRDMVRNNPIATGAIETNCVNVVGTGLKLQSRIDRDILTLTDLQADDIENRIEREWRLFFETTECDCARILNGHGLANLTFRATLENGDSFTNLPRFSRGMTPYKLRLQVIEADRICNENRQADSLILTAGVEKDPLTGAPVTYHIMDQHPGNMLAGSKIKQTWTKIPAYGNKSGLRNVLHHYRMLRAGQSRGVPYLAPVIEQLKQIDRYTEAELMAAVISAMFTVFIKTESGDGELAAMTPTAETGGSSTDEDYKLASGAIIGLAPNESIETANPSRPNASFDPFFLAITRQIGIALGIPYEVLIKHFTSSYSAARAALLDAWKHFVNWRTWLVDSFYQPVYEIFLYEAISAGRIAAPGFFADPLIRLAYSGAQWIGPSPGQVDPLKEVNAAEKRLNLVISSRAEETAALTGGDFERNMRQVIKEKKKLDEAGIPWSSKNSTDAAQLPQEPPMPSGEE